MFLDFSFPLSWIGNFLGFIFQKQKQKKTREQRINFVHEPMEMGNYLSLDYFVANPNDNSDNLGSMVVPSESITTKEFEQLAQLTDSLYVRNINRYESALKQENLMKNRYINVLPEGLFFLFNSVFF
jgi:hypothetical protein